MEEGKVGLKETKEFIAGCFALGFAIRNVTKDGLQPIQDGLALIKKYMEDEEFKKAINEGISGINKIPSEVKAIDALEGYELGAYLFSFAPKFIAEFHK